MDSIIKNIYSTSGSIKINEVDSEKNQKNNTNFSILKDESNKSIHRSYFEILKPNNIASAVIKIVNFVFVFFQKIFLYFFPNSSFAIRSDLARLNKAIKRQVEINKELLQRQKYIFEMDDFSNMANDQIMERYYETKNELKLQEQYLEERLKYLESFFNVIKNKKDTFESEKGSVKKGKSLQSYLILSNNLINHESSKKKFEFEKSKEIIENFIEKRKSNFNVNILEIEETSRSTNPEIIRLKKELIKWMDCNEELRFNLDELENAIYKQIDNLRYFSEKIDSFRLEIKSNQEFLKDFEGF
jgi:hypothetical protein